MKDKNKGFDWFATLGLTFGSLGTGIAIASSLLALSMIWNSNDLTLAGLLLGATGLWAAISWSFFEQVSNRKLKQQIDDGFKGIQDAVDKCNGKCQADESLEWSLVVMPHRLPQDRCA